MKLARAAFLLVATLSLNAAGIGGIDGYWEAKYVSGVCWKTIGSAEFEFKADGDKLTGVAHVGMGWPGTTPISSGKIDGDRISFMVPGEQNSSSGLPHMRFAGMIHGDEIQLTMTLYYGPEINPQNDRDTELKGKRIP